MVSNLRYTMNSVHLLQKFQIKPKFNFVIYCKKDQLCKNTRYIVNFSPDEFDSCQNMEVNSEIPYGLWWKTRIFAFQALMTVTLVRGARKYSYLKSMQISSVTLKIPSTTFFYAQYRTFFIAFYHTFSDSGDCYFRL